MIAKPDSIADDPRKSAKWDELTEGRDFQKSDIPALTLLCNWYQVIDRCIDDITYGDGVQVAYQNDMGDLKAMPQLSTMKQASAEIRALNKQLGINDEARDVKPEVKVTVFDEILASRQSRAKGKARAKTG